MINVHIIFNAHIDPIWLWPWSAGLDEALATCRSACDRLVEGGSESLCLNALAFVNVDAF